MLEMNKTKGVETKEVKEERGSMANFIQKQEVNRIANNYNKLQNEKSIINRAPKLGFGLSGGSITLTKGCGARNAQNEAAKVGLFVQFSIIFLQLRAIAMLKSKNSDNTKRGLKRPSMSI